MNDFTRHTLCPVIASVIWGTAFVAQSVCGRYLPTFTINACRSLIAFAVLYLAAILFKQNKGSRKDKIAAGLLCGTMLFIASNLQQFGITATSAGKAGFVTALYIVLVPVLQIFLRKPAGLQVWIAVAIAVVGMYFLCVTDSFTIETGDAALLACALAFALQILAVDRFAGKIDSIALTAAEFLVAGILAAICAALFGERPTASDFSACIWPLLYVAVFSSGIAYTLQVVAQKGGNPAVVSLLMSLESVFAVIGGVVLLGEKMTGREWLGCGLMAIAVVTAQISSKTAEPPEQKE